MKNKHLTEFNEYVRNVYRQVLARHGLLEEANQRIEAGKSMTYDYKTDELPFQ